MSRAVDTANLLPETGRASITDYRGLPHKHKKRHTRRVSNHQSDRQHDDLKHKHSRGRRKHGRRS
jgi:hypothetical protein